MGIEDEFPILDARLSTETTGLEMVPRFDAVPNPSESASVDGQVGQKFYGATSESHIAVREDAERRLRSLHAALGACLAAGLTSEAASITRQLLDALTGQGRRTQTG